LNLKPGERLLLRLNNCPEFPVSFLGAIKAGLLPIPSSSLLTWDELKFLLEDSETAVLVTNLDLLPPELLKERPPSLKQILLLSPKEAPLPSETLRWEDQLKNASSSFQTEPTPAEAPAFWLYTSGTEGRPKAVIHAHRSIRAHDGRTRLWQDFKQGDLIFNTSSLHWSYALTCGLLDVWRHGLSTLVFRGNLDPEKIGRLIQHFGVTTFMSVPGIYRKLVEDSVGATHASPLQGLRACLSAGEKLSEEIRERFRNSTGHEIYEGLGMTEHSVYLVQSYGQEIVKNSCGKPVPESRITLLREDLTEAGVGETGILASHRSCEGLMLGYHHTNPPNPPFSKGGNGSSFFSPKEFEFPPLKKGGEGGFEGDWFLSGDLAHRDTEGNFFFEGRRDDVITAGGHRISPLEVEWVLNECPIVSESAVVAWEISPGKTVVASFIVLRDKLSNHESSQEQITLYAERHLAKYKIPRKIFFVDSLPKTESGKVKRKELRAPKGA
jgi:acyl-coenzyme A synthetase/AMP-(fatty) acid ligase